MTESVVGSILPGSRLQRWLRYDESRIPVVETAYDDYIRHGRPGVWALLSLPIAVLFAIVVGLATHDFKPHSTSLAIASLVGLYGSLVVPVLLTPRSSRVELLRGCVDTSRACVFAAVSSLVICILEWMLIASLSALHVPFKKPAYDLLTGGIVFSFVYAAIIAPVLEEFLVQGWFQTRMRRFGSGWAAVLATVFFVLIHVPKSAYDLVRTPGLAFNGYLRATTRSLGASIAAHSSNNIVFFVMYAAYVLSHHKVSH